MALPVRAASARTAADEVQDQRHQARTQACPRPEEMHEVDRPHVRDAGPVEPDGEEEEPQADADEGADQRGAAGPFFADAVHRGVSLADVANPCTKSIETPTSIQLPPHRLSVVSCPSTPKRATKQRCEKNSRGDEI